MQRIESKFYNEREENKIIFRSFSIDKCIHQALLLPKTKSNFVFLSHFCCFRIYLLACDNKILFISLHRFQSLNSFIFRKKTRTKPKRYRIRYCCCCYSVSRIDFVAKRMFTHFFLLLFVVVYFSFFFFIIFSSL